METKNREKMLLIAVGICVGLYVLNLVLISPLSDSWSARRERINKLRTTIADGIILQKNAKSIQDQWNSMSTNTLPLNPSLAEDKLYKAFQIWAASSQVVLVNQRPQAKDSDDPAYSNYEWHADVTGTLTQIFNFLSSVEAGPLGLKVDSIELSSRDERGAQLALGLTVSGLILNPSTNSVTSN